jgi:hypothetical protein
MDREQILAFRLARHGLDRRRRISMAEAAACPASDFQRDSALLALGARAQSVSRDAFAEAIDGGDLVLGFNLRAAIHACAPDDVSLFGRTAVSDDDEELGRQLGDGAMKGLKKAGVTPTDALERVAEATREVLRGGRTVDRQGLHDGLRERLSDELLPWCKGCKSNHVSPMLWRYAGVVIGMRMNSERLYRSGKPGRRGKPADLARTYLRFYGPADAKGFAAWARLAPGQARRVWDEIEDELELVEWDGEKGWVEEADLRAVQSPPTAAGTRLVPARDPYLQQDRETLVPDAAVRKKLFRPVASPGAVLRDGALAGLWKAKAGKKGVLDVAVERRSPLDQSELEAECSRVAKLRGFDSAEVTVS